MADTPLRQDLVLRTASDVEVALCTEGGVGHDWRVEAYRDYPDEDPPRESYVCVWCRTVQCGDVGQSDDQRCAEPYHHQTRHVTTTGKTWPVGGMRPS